MDTRAFVHLFLILFLSLTLSAQTVTQKQIHEWQKLYPKLNSKMARMEEILNYIDRFLGNNEFKNEILEKAAEFSFLAQQSTKNTPSYLTKEDQKLFVNALNTTHELGNKLYHAVKSNNNREAKDLFSKLDTLRRNSHSKWAL